MRRVGAHVSGAGGYEKAVERAAAIGANCLQIFSGSPRVWQRPAIVPEVLQNFKKVSDEQDIRPIFVHALYLVNLCSDKTESVQKSKKVLTFELQFGSHFDCAGVVVHLGSHQGRGWESSRDSLPLIIQEIIDDSGVNTPFLIENSAGQNGKVSSDFSEIRHLLDVVDRPQLGWCYDTCHGWAAGYGATIPGSRGDLFAEIEKYNLWDSLKCIHVNDSRDLQSSGKDRHANIGQGNIPTEELKAIINHPKLAHIPLITEAPGLDGNGPDAFNIQAITDLVKTEL